MKPLPHPLAEARVATTGRALTLDARGGKFPHGVGDSGSWETSLSDAIDKLTQRAHKIKGESQERQRRGSKVGAVAALQPGEGTIPRAGNVRRIEQRRPIVGDPTPRMAVQRASGLGASYIDIVDRVLDKGIVIDAWMRVSVSGIDVITVKARVIVASIDTYLGRWPALDGAATIAKRSSIFDPGSRAPDRVQQS
jgi:hypothetical protein